MNKKKLILITTSFLVLVLCFIAYYAQYLLKKNDGPRSQETKNLGALKPKYGPTSWKNPPEKATLTPTPDPRFYIPFDLGIIKVKILKMKGDHYLSTQPKLWYDGNNPMAKKEMISKKQKLISVIKKITQNEDPSIFKTNKGIEAFELVLVHNLNNCLQIAKFRRAEFLNLKIK